MKKIIYFAAAISLYSCAEKKAEEEKVKNDFVTISGKITNIKEGDIVIEDYKRKYKKNITLNEDGSFSDTMKLTESTPFYMFQYGGEYTGLFLKNGAELSISLDTKEFDESLMFEGDFTNEHRYLVAKTLKQDKFDFDGLISAKNETFEEDLKNEINSLDSLLNSFQNLDSDLISHQKDYIKKFGQGMKMMHAKAIEQQKVFDKLKGNPSPTFKDYLSSTGDLVSLDSFKGKYTYIDVWATWCKPCTDEIPYIKEFLNTEEAKKINVVSISVDKPKNEEKWKEMVAKEGVEQWHQLKADSAFNSSFIKEYDINSIPRFILLDPQGIVVNPNAPRPSSDEFKEMISELNI